MNLPDVAGLISSVAFQSSTVQSSYSGNDLIRSGLDQASYSVGGDTTTTGMANSSELLCRTRRELGATPDDYYADKSWFSLVSCYKCAQYLKFNTSMTSYPRPDTDPDGLNEICDQLNYEKINCDRWKKCCFDAVKCCDEQINRQLSNLTDSSSKMCPQAWDGFSCVSQTAAGSVAKIACPNFLYPEMDSGPFRFYASRQCDNNGEWRMYEASGGEYTNYLACATGGQDWDQQLNTFKIICEVTSIITLASSIFCFIYCRRLRNLAAYKVHTQMFLAMLLYTVSCLLRETIVHTFTLNSNFPTGCEAITMLVRLFMITAYSAMSVEAFYLHWNVAAPFKPLMKLRVLFAVGWTIPLVIVAVYVALRISIGQEEAASYCWIHPWGYYEWIIYGPNFFCLLLNIIFLINLFRITCRLQSVPTVPSPNRRNSRRSPNHPCELLQRREFRSMLTFTFLFGAPQALVVIRPNGLTGAGFKAYEMLSVAVQMLQGTFASILLCYLNAEVRRALNRTALGNLFTRERARYESIVSSLSVRVRGSIGALERRSGRAFSVSGTNGNDGANHEMTSMLPRIPENENSLHNSQNSRHSSNSSRRLSTGVLDDCPLERNPCDSSGNNINNASRNSNNDDQSSICQNSIDSEDAKSPASAVPVEEKEKNAETAECADEQQKLRTSAYFSKNKSDTSNEEFEEAATGEVV